MSIDIDLDIDIVGQHLFHSIYCSGAGLTISKGRVTIVWFKLPCETQQGDADQGYWAYWVVTLVEWQPHASSSFIMWKRLVKNGATAALRS